jgi:hypothetical protein
MTLSEEMDKFISSTNNEDSNSSNYLMPLNLEDSTALSSAALPNAHTTVTSTIKASDISTVVMPKPTYTKAPLLYPLLHQLCILQFTLLYSLIF